MGRLTNALFTKTQQNVLGLLYGQPERSFYTREILSLTGMGVHTIKRELDRMVSAGILVSFRVGNQKHFQANPECPIYAELKGIVNKTVGVVDVVSGVLEPLAEKIDTAFVYGSVAKGKDSSDSDIDLMIISDQVGYAELMECLLPAQEKLGRVVNPTVYGADEFKDKLSKGNHFLERVIEQEKILITGSVADYGAVKQSGQDRDDSL